MEKNNKRGLKKLLKGFFKNPYLSKNVIIYFMLLLFFSLSIFFVWKRHEEKKKQPPSIPPKAFVLKKSQDSGIDTSINLEKQLITLTNRVTALETRNIPIQPSLGISRKIITFELLKGVLDNLIPMGALKTFLQKTPEPWALALSAALAPLQDVKTYSQLEALLVFPPPLQPLSLWQKIKRKIKHLVLIRKIDEKGDYTLGQADELKKALHNQDISKALEYYNKLPIGEKEKLSAWKKLADDRFMLETKKNALLLEIAKD